MAVVRLQNGDSPDPGGLSRPEVGRRYTGCVVEWEGTHGFLSSTLIRGRVFLGAGNVSGADSIAVGTSVNFELARAEGTSFQAIKATAYV